MNLLRGRIDPTGATTQPDAPIRRRQTDTLGVSARLPREVLVVGAGPAGLAVTHELRQAGVDALVLERGADTGAGWRGRHEDLRLNTIRQLSGLPEMPIPRRYGRWVARDDYVAYLEAYAKSKAIPIEFETKVRHIERVGSMWQLDTSSGPRHAHHAVVATGPDRVPWIPSWPDMSAFRGEVRHVATARRPADFAECKVLVVGGGNSGVEWAEHLVQARSHRVWLSVRRPPNLLPREIAGLPLHPLAVALRGLPITVRDLTARLLRRLFLDDLTAYGLPAPPEGPYRRLAETGVTVAIDTSFSRSVRQGRIEVVAEIDRFTPHEVVLTDGMRLRPDVVLAATGYRPGLGPLVGHLGVLRTDGRPRIDRSGASSQSGLWFIGFTTAIEGTLRLHPIEARRIARAVRRELSMTGPGLLNPSHGRNAHCPRSEDARISGIGRERGDHPYGSLTLL